MTLNPKKSELACPNPLGRYIYSLYWAVTTLSTVDFGNPAPSTMPQVGAAAQPSMKQPSLAQHSVCCTPLLAPILVGRPVQLWDGGGMAHTRFLFLCINNRHMVAAHSLGVQPRHPFTCRPSAVPHAPPSSCCSTLHWAAISWVRRVRGREEGLWG